MTREIKFRAWDKEYNKYIYDGIDFAIACLDLKGNDSTNVCIGFTEEFEGQRFIIEQFTGLYDKNGIEIYEGDIVRTLICFGTAGEEYRDIVVQYDDLGQISIQLWVYNESKTFLPEVIGNIHENPELLE